MSCLGWRRELVMGDFAEETATDGLETILFVERFVFGDGVEFGMVFGAEARDIYLPHFAFEGLLFVFAVALSRRDEELERIVKRRQVGFLAGFRAGDYVED